MSKQLYEEALADVKKLKEIAEDNAKKALIEAVSPRIKDLIEAELLREQGEKEDDGEVSDGLLLDDEPIGSFDDSDFSSPPVSLAAQFSPPVDMGVSAAISPPDEEGKVTLDLDALAVEPAGEEYELSNESIRLLNPLVKKVNKAVALQVESRLFRLGEAVEKFAKASRVIKKSTGYKQKLSEMVSDVERLYEYLQDSAGDLQDKGVYEGKLEDVYKKLNKLTEQNMNRRWRSMNEAELTLKLTGVPDEVEDELDDIGVDLVTGSAGGDAGGDEEEESPDDEGEEPEADADSDSGDEGEDVLDLGGDDEGGDEAEEEKAEEAHKMESRRLRDNLVVEIDEGMLRREISRMRRLREEAEVQAWGEGPGDVSDEFEDDDLGEPLELDLRESDLEEYGMEETDRQDEADKDPVDELDELEQYDEADKDPVDELDELEQYDEGEVDQAEDMRQMGGNVAAQSTGPGAQTQKQGRQPGGSMKETLLRRLRRERNIQLEAKKRATQAKKQQTEAQKKMKQKQQEAQQKMKQKKHLEAQKAKKEAQQKQKKSQQMKEAYNHFARVYNESVRREARLNSMLAEANRRSGRTLNGSSSRSAGETNNLRSKLAETNLFNTKLLYCNKLLQNEAFTKRQKAEIIERLDEARSEREVKLVYESLTKTLVNTSRSLNEGRVVGSSSQPTRPASTVLNEGIETDRWAKLAGIK
jgi:hypothetical protein